MIVTTADVIPGQAVQVLGLVRGNIVTSKNIGRDLMAGMKSIVGGEIVSYTQMTDEARQVAEDRMVTAAQNLGPTPLSPCVSRATASPRAQLRFLRMAPQ